LFREETDPKFRDRLAQILPVYANASNDTGSDDLRLGDHRVLAACSISLERTDSTPIPSKGIARAATG
jgi:hypothetical protein